MPTQHDNKKIQRIGSSIAFLVILSLSLALMLYWGNIKQGYHVDELYSYGLANSEYLPFMHFGESGYSVKDWMKEYGAGESVGDLVSNVVKDLVMVKDAGYSIKDTDMYQAYLIAQANSNDTRTTTWMDGSAYMDYLAASETNRFNYASVYYNQRGDVHPPLFYILLHTVSSFFPGQFSKWFGLSVNITAICLVLMVLYHLGKKHLGGDLPALVICAVYGLSTAGVSTGIFLRMYALLTLFVVSCFCVHLSILQDMSLKGHTGDLMFVTLFGFLTQYYYVIYAIGIALVAGVVFLMKKQFRLLGRYILTLGLTAAIGLCIWPFAIKHVFGGYRGQASIGTLAGGDFSTFMMKYCYLFMERVTWNGASWVLPLLIGLCLLSLLVRWGVAVVFPAAAEKITDAANISNEERNVDAANAGEVAREEAEEAETKPAPDIFSRGIAQTAVLLIFPMALYICLVSQIVPFLTDRYFMCGFPFLLILAVECGYLTGKWWGQRSACVTVIATGLLLLCLNNCVTHQPEHLYWSGQETVYVPVNTDCVYVLPDGDWNESAEDTNLIARCKRVAVVYLSNLEVLRGYEHLEGSTLMVCIQTGLDKETVLSQVQETLQVEDLAVDHTQDSATFYRLFLQ